MKKIKYIITIFIIWCSFILASAQTQTLGISQSQSGNPSNACHSCYTISIQYSISNVAATGTVIVATFPNNILDICSYGGASVTTAGSTTTLTFNLGNLPTSASSVSYQVRFKPGVTCNGTTASLSAKISTNEHPTPILSSPLTMTAVATEGWSIAKYIATDTYQWWSGYPAANPFQYYVSTCGNTVDVYYHFHITNAGCINLSGASVTDNLPAGATVVGVHSGWPLSAGNSIPYTTAPGTVTWNIGSTPYLLDVSAFASNYYAYNYYVHIQFPVSQVGTIKCNTATLKGTNVCTNVLKTVTTASECIKLNGLTPGSACGNFGTPYWIGGTPYYFIGCPAWLNISLGLNNQCASNPTTLNNIGYSTAIPGQIHVDSMRMSAIPAGKYVTVTLNTTCGTYTHTYNGSLPASTVNFYAAPFSLPPSCVITNFSLTSNMGITGNNMQNFGQLYFTILPVTWNTSTVVNAGTPVPVNGNYFTSSGNYGCTVSFVTSSRIPAIESIKGLCSSNNSCLNPGDTIKYSVAVRNYGFANFTGGSIRDVLPVGLQYVPNSTTFGKYSAYTSCISSNQTGTGITVAHAESAASTNLQWNLPTLAASCNTGSDWYVVNFKVVVTISAPAGWLLNQENIYNSSNQIVNEVNTYNNYNYVNICERKVPLELTKEVSADNITWDSCVSVPPGATVYYRLKVKNPGNVPFSQIRMMDILPTPGDKQVVNCNSRGSTIPIYLTSALPLGNASTIDYTTNFLPSRGTYLNLIPDNTIGCNSPATWLPFSSIIPPSAIQNQKAIKIDFGSYTLPAGQTETYVFSAQVPPGAPINSIGWNSFAATASQNSVQTLGAESRNVCVKVIESGCGCIGNFVWADTNGNGLQDPGEPGINGCTITLYDASNNPVGLPHISSNNISNQPGYYQFCGLTAGTYHIVVTPPPGFVVTVQNSSNPALNSDINPSTNMSANFQFNCQDNNDLDIGLVVDLGCNCKGSQWGEIFLTNKPGGTDNPQLFDSMPVNKLNKKQLPAGNLTPGRNIAVPGHPEENISNPGNHFSMPLNCEKRDTVTLSCNTTYNFNANYICTPASCSSTLIVVTTPSGSTSSSSNSASFTTSTSGIYTVKIYGKCGNVVCDSCIFRFRVVCPICPCDYPLSVKPGKKSLTVVNTTPAYSLYNQAFNITSPVGVAFTQVRAEVISFNLTSNFNNECIACKNLPYTWGSIYNAADISTNALVRDSITMGPNPPVTQFTPVPGNTHQNPRETIWENYNGFTLPSSLNVRFILPHPSMIGCCTLYARICVKFTFRDLNCRECEVIVCFTVTIPPVKPQIDSALEKEETEKGSNMVKTTRPDCPTCGTQETESFSAGQDPLMTGEEETSGLEPGSQGEEEVKKAIQLQIEELRKLKANGARRGDVELLPLLEKQIPVQPEKGKIKK